MAEFPVRVLWNTAPWFDEGQTWSAWSFEDAPSNPASYNKPSSGDGLDLGGTNGSLLTQGTLRDPRVGHLLSWSEENSDDFGGFSGSYQERGVIPANQEYYTVRVDHGAAVEADCLFIIGFENADISIWRSNNGSSWSRVSISSPWDDELRQADHWSGNISQKFVTFTKATARYWRVDFERVPGQPFYGKLSSIIGGVHYEYEAVNEGDGGPNIHGVGQSTGGIFQSANRGDPAFQGQRFIFPFGTDDDLRDYLRMAYRKTHGDPVVIQYYHAKFPDLFCTYGVLATGSRFRIRHIDDQFEIRYSVNELTTSRTPAYDYYV